MKRVLHNTTDTETFQRMVRTAQKGTYNGSSITEYFESCRWFLERYDCICILTRDEGYHSSGWWKNPDYERCWHLSISFPGGMNWRKLEHVLLKLFGNKHRMLWCEPPYSEIGKRNGVYHYRLFCDEHWQAIMPRGEVYNKEFTEIGWKSFSELHQK